MGGSGGGGLSGIDLSKLTKVADDRLRELAKTGTRILFLCESGDRRSLDSHLARSNIFQAKKIVVMDASDEEAAVKEIDNSSVIVIFTATIKSAPFLDRIVEVCLARQKQGIHVKATDDALIPSKAMAYRWPSLSWDRLEEMFAQ
jgi:hypothetical protein